MFPTKYTQYSYIYCSWNTRVKTEAKASDHASDSVHRPSPLARVGVPPRHRRQRRRRRAPHLSFDLTVQLPIPSKQQALPVPAQPHNVPPLFTKSFVVFRVKLSDTRVACRRLTRPQLDCTTISARPALGRCNGM